MLLLCFSNDLVTIPVFKLLKQSCSNNNKCVPNLKYFSQSPAICPALPLQHYVDRTKSISGRISLVFISFRKRIHLSSSPPQDAGSRLLFVKQALIHTSVFKSYSTRAAASSARDNSMLVDETLQSAGWTNASVFRHYYDKIVLPY